MKIAEIKEILKAEIICGEHQLDTDLHAACGADMMSDVLAFVKDQAVLLTGLINPQVVRTAEMMDIRCIVFVRGKQPEEALTQLAVERDIVLMKTPFRMFSACGLLFEKGLRGGNENV